MKSRFNGVLLIVIGGIALAHNLGYLNLDLFRLLRVWWPAILIAVGIVFLFSARR